MLEKILLISLVLISFIQADNEQIVKLQSKYLEVGEKIDLDNAQNFLICVKISEDLKIDNSFFITIRSEDKGKTFEKKFPYKFLDDSCKDEVLVINYQDLKENFSNIKDDLITENNDNGFIYEYEFTKKENSQKYMRMLIHNFDGNKMTINCSKMSISTVIIIIVVSVVVGLFVIVAIIIVIVCCVCHKKRVASVQQQYQSSFVNDPIIPRDTVVDQ